MGGPCQQNVLKLNDSHILCSPGPVGIGYEVVPSRLAAVTHVSHIHHIHIFSFLFLDNKSHFHIALWSLAFCGPSEKDRWVDLARVFWSHVIIFEAQTAPWVALFNSVDENFSPVPWKQPPTAWKSTYWNSVPVFFSQLKRCSFSIHVHVEVFFFFSFIIVRWI